MACYEEKTNIITYLLQNGALVNKHGIRGDTPLHIAVSNCSKKSVLELIDMGAHVDAVNKQNETPLHIVTRQNRIEILQILLSRAKNIDVCSHFNKRTPFKSLMEDMHIDKLNMAIMLVRAGCNVNLSYNRMALSCYDTLSFNSIYHALSQPNYSEMFIIVNSSESPFKNLFKITKINFKFASSLLNAVELFENDDMQSFNSGVLPFDEFSPFRSYVNLIEIIFRAGYRANLSDSQLYRDSWLFNYLSGFEIKPNSLECKAKQVLDYYFLLNFNKPFSLQNLCKFKLRLALNKPISKSIQLLDIPAGLKTFLNLDSIEVLI